MCRTRGLVWVLACVAMLWPGGAAAGNGRGRGRRQDAPWLTAVVVTPDGPFVHVSLRGTRPMPAVTPMRTTEGPPRLFVDLPGVVMGDLPARIPGAGPIARVRVAQNSLDPPVTRVVFDLAGDVSFGVAPPGPFSNDITIAVASTTMTTSAAATSTTTTTSATATGTPSLPAPPAPPAPKVAPPVVPTAARQATTTVPGVPVPPPPPAPGRSTTSPVPPKAPATPIAVRPAQAAAVRPQPAPAPRTAATPPTTPATPSGPAPAVAPTVSSPVAPTSPTPATSGLGMGGSPRQAPSPAAATTSTGTPMAVQTSPTAPRPVSGFGMGTRAARPTGRVSIYASGAKASQADDFSTGYGDVTTAVSYSFLDRSNDGVEYSLDMRHTAYTIEGRAPRVSIYNGFVGARLAGGHAGVRFGHLWLDDLGGLGALAGAQLEARSGEIPTSGLGRWRGGVFGGLDPNVYRLGYGDGIRKMGAYGVLEGTRGRRHVAGYVNVHNGDMTERSVLSFANFLPVGPFFAYQVAEYDLAPIAGGAGHSGLTYFFTNARYTVGRRLELQGTISRGRSVDARGMSDDIQAGRPVSQQSIDGLLYQSYGGRVTAEVLPRVRVYGGYSRDKNNRDDAPTGRWLSGGYATNVLGSGVDLTVSDSRITRSTGSYHSTYLSAGREFGQRVYATAEFSSALSLVRFVRGDGIVVESRPSTKRFGGNATVQTWKQTSLFLSLERTLDNDDYREWRALTGVTFRLR